MNSSVLTPFNALFVVLWLNLINQTVFLNNFWHLPIFLFSFAVLTVVLLMAHWWKVAYLINGVERRSNWLHSTFLVNTLWSATPFHRNIELTCWFLSVIVFVTVWHSECWQVSMVSYENMKGIEWFQLIGNGFEFYSFKRFFTNFVSFVFGLFVN